MLLSPVLVILMVYHAYLKVNLAAEGIPRTNTLLQWVIILIVFIPICAGLFLFGKYAMANEFDHLEE